MATLIEIGGVFLFAQDTSALAVWYERHLGQRLTALDQGGRQPTFYQELYYLLPRY